MMTGQTNQFYTPKGLGQNTLVTDAVLSDCGRFRFRLTRIWNPDLPRVLWVLLNPSTANAEQDDPTIRRLMGFTRSWQSDGSPFGGIEVVNLFALRAADPQQLYQTHDLGLDNNDTHLLEATRDPANTLVVCGWGANGGHLQRDQAVINLLTPVTDLCALARPSVKEQGVAEEILLTQSGKPRHPLYLRGDSSPVVVWSKTETLL